MPNLSFYNYCFAKQFFYNKFFLLMLNVEGSQQENVRQSWEKISD
jgi:hypothetical protein